MAQSGFELVGEEAEVVQHPSTPAPKAKRSDRAAATSMLMLALKALSQRALVAASALVTAGAILSVWLLWFTVLPTSPTVQQLTGVGMYSVFILAIEWIRRKGG